MKHSCASNDNRRAVRARRAMTLVEVVVALTLLASLVVGMMKAFSAHHRQGLLASQRMQAIEVADALLTEWYRSADASVPRNASGLVPGRNAYVWRTQTVLRNRIETLPVEVVQLQIFSNRGAALRSPVERAGMPRSGEPQKPLAQVDILLPAERVIIGEGGF